MCNLILVHKASRAIASSKTISNEKTYLSSKSVFLLWYYCCNCSPTNAEVESEHQNGIQNNVDKISCNCKHNAQFYQHSWKCWLLVCPIKPTSIHRKCNTESILPLAYNGVFVSLKPRKTPWLAREITTAGAPRPRKDKYSRAGVCIGDVCIQNLVC